ncbi:MAG: class I SAM-dependent methyltransferase [Verrucomicrobia bacterium]|nr:class I SAM-dependent methyltransferase [Verrucomicrobiota bacterium]
MIDDDLLSSVSSYYTSKITQYGCTPKGVDWNGIKGQDLRFEQLKKVIQGKDFFSINDLGCGYGALFQYLIKHYEDFSYQGTDVSAAMVSEAIGMNYGERAKFKKSSNLVRIADYSVASGVFNVKLDQSNETWGKFVLSVLDDLNNSSRIGFAFNCLTSYSDIERMKDNLYYANCLEYFDLCKKRYSRNVSLMHDYDLYEFTIIVRKF